MANISLEWDDFWAAFQSSPKEYQQNWLEQIDLDNLVRRISNKEMLKVIKCAPIYIQDRYMQVMKDKKEPYLSPVDAARKLRMGINR